MYYYCSCIHVFCFISRAPPQIYTLSLHDALPIFDLGRNDATVLHLDRCLACRACEAVCPSGVPYGRLIEETRAADRKSTRLNSSHRCISYAVFCLKKKKNITTQKTLQIVL